MKKFKFTIYLILIQFCCYGISFGQTVENLKFEKEQDSLRIVLLNKKENKKLSNSVFQELYIRDIVNIQSDKLLFDVNLDLHFWDCGAPDSYSHILSFTLKINQIHNLPKKLLVTETEIENEQKSLAKVIEFELLHSKKDFLVYHSEKFKKTLVIFKTDKASGTSLYYFQNLSREKIVSTSIYKIVEDGMNDEDAPWHSTRLAMDYEYFLAQ